MHAEIEDVGLTGPAPLIGLSIQEEAVRTLLALIRQHHPLSCASSFGKDSTTTTFLFLEAVRRAVGEGIKTTHYITTSSTGVENPSMERHAETVQEEIRSYCERHGLPVEVITVYPSLASSFVVSTVGRGTLPRFPENGRDRACSVDWKVLPQKKLAAELQAAAAQQNVREPITVIGTRFAESSVRKSRMTDRGESQELPVRDADGRLVISIIAQWSLEDVWDTLEMLLEPEACPYPTPISSASITRLFELYRDANEGQCGINLGDGGNKAPCGSRFGCHTCCVVGDQDKSMAAMLNEPKYEYMRPLNDFRNELMASQFDMDNRELIGRTISSAGYLPVRPDVYSLSFRQSLLSYMLSMDANERDRAEQVEADIATGKIEDTPENRMMASPMFELVSLSQLVAVDFHWSMHAYASHAFPAISMWYEINVLGRRYSIPPRTKAPKITIPTKRWFYVGKFDHDAPADGLRDYQAELWNKYRHPDRPATGKEVNGEKTVWFDEQDLLTVDAERACMFVTCEFEDIFIESRRLRAIDSARFWLNEEIISLPKGHAARYQHIAKRGQYFANLADRLNLSPYEMDRYLERNSISNAEHEKLGPSRSESIREDDAGFQFGLFGFAEAA